MSNYPMNSFPNNPTPFFDFNSIGFQLQNLQRQMTEHGRIVAQQQQAIMQLLQQQQTTSTVQWPSTKTQRVPRLMEVDTNVSSMTSLGQQRRFTSRRRTPKGNTLGDFIPAPVRKGRDQMNHKKVRFAEDKSYKKNREERQGTRRTSTNVQKDKSIGKPGSVAQTNARTTDTTQTFNISLANRFLPLATESSEDDLINEIDSHGKESDTDVPVITNVIGPSPNNGNGKKKSKGKGKSKEKNTLQITLAPGQPRTVAEKPKGISVNIPRFDQRSYLQPERIKIWLNNNVQAVRDDHIMSASQGAAVHIDRFADFAVKTAYLFDQRARALFDVQVWLFYLQLGTKEHQPYWAKEVVGAAKTREDALARQICENRIVKLNAKLKCLADEITTISTQFGLANDAEENEKVMFNYMNESLIHVRRQNELKMKMAKIERAENVAWENFITLATAPQVTLARMVKAQLLKTREKSIRYEAAAVHATPQIDMLPKALPSLELNFQFDKESMSEEDAKDIFKSMKDITRDYRLKATELYIRAAKVELEYHNTRLRQLMEGSVLASTLSDTESSSDSEATKAFQVFVKIHLHHTAARAETIVLRLKERHQRVDAPDPVVPSATTRIQHIPMQELLGQTGQIQEVLLLNRN